MLEVRLLGTFSIRHDGEPVVIASRAGQSLFAFLILTAGTLHRREKLAGMFWPDTTEDKARAYLRHELWRIRKPLSGKTDEEFFISDTIHVSFDPAVSYELDTVMLTKAKDATTSQDLMAALTFYRGELLPGFYDDWVMQERDYLHALFEQKIADLLDLLTKKKRWSDIIEWAERWISLGERSEVPYRALMVAHAAVGDHARVVAVYERCRQALESLGLEPSDETRALTTKRRRSLHIPVPLTSFIGREHEVQEISELLSRNRLVTLTGAGGVGKTRLSIQVAAEVLDRFPDGIWFLDLAPLQDPELIPNTLAGMLGLSETSDANLSITNQLINYFQPRTALIIFDNCEHLIESAARLVHTLLSQCEGLSILATSREALRVAGEVPYRVPSLEIPKIDTQIDVRTIAKTESVQLFTERASADSRGFAVTPQNIDAIAQICQRLDGIPLAIELAAARTPVLDVEQILTRLDDRFKLLTSGTRTALPRQKTLWATIEWSYSLLPEKERILFRRLAVFTGGWTLETAEKVCSGEGIQQDDVLDLLAQLVNKSLVVVSAGEKEARYRRLEIIREFAREKLIEATEAGRLQNRHLAYFLELAQEAEKEIHGPNQIAWMDRLETEHDNLRSALGWCVSNQNTAAALRLLAALSWGWGLRDHFAELASWFTRIRALPEIGDYPALYAKLLNYMGHHGWLSGDLRDTKSVLEESQAIWLSLGVQGEPGLAEALEILGGIALFSGEDIHTAQAYFEKSFELCQKHKDERGMSIVTCDLGSLAFVQGRYDEAEKLFMKSLAKFRELGDKWRMAYVLSGLAGLALFVGDYERSGEFWEQNLELFRELRSRFALAWPFLGLAWVALHGGKYGKAKDLFAEALKLAEEMSNREMITLSLIGLASVMGLTGQPGHAARLFGAVEFLREGITLMEPQDQQQFDHHVAVVREQLDELAFVDAWTRGRAMTLKQAIDFALKESAG